MKLVPKKVKKETRGRKKKEKTKFIKRLPKEKKFIFNNGNEASNIKELADLLGEIDDYTFEHHVNEHKNDFFTWVKYVHKDERLAQTIQPIQKKEEMQRCIYKHITDNLW